ncbi:hypothetical protein [Paraglaciecola hydrolytica]|uniref:Uncharacterized protein n=1 Tax=Paraglaciecola hydrolytica TaxID=1799789 RepID=A0A136A3B6_9ALTE|nr:hypothetical protein [Paraglaciecola hydrolytica]KXI29620.1 hypothetical protein AX660_06095 [Paraglaciecola hydrolytica]
MNKADFESDLQQQLVALNREKQPERELWSGIELALVNSPDVVNKPKSGKIYALVAGVALIGLVSLLSFHTAQKHPNGSDLIASLSAQHQQQKQALLVQFQDQPALTSNWQEQVAELDKAELAIKAALKNEPNNMALLKLLQNVYQQQISLIERVHSPKWSQI